MGKNAIHKDINNAPNLAQRIDIICQRLQIPDLGSRSGLRKIHRSFQEVYQRLRACYRDNAQHYAVQGAIVTVYAKMCTDALLRDKLFREGFLSQIMPLVNIPICRNSALNCLVTITHHGGREARNILAKYTPDLIKLAKDNIDDPLLTEKCVVIIAHCASSILSPEGDKFDEKSFETLGSLEILLGFIDSVLRKPTTTPKTFSHALGLLTTAPHHGRASFLAHIPSLTFLVACLRSTDIQTRVSGLSGVLRFHYSISEPENPSLDPQKLLANLHRRKPAAVTDILVRYGMERAEITMYLSTMRDYQKAMMECAQDRTHDLYTLGMKIYELIGRTEYSVSDGMFQDENGETIDIGLPFVRWLDALPHCANAIRARGIPTQRDAANIVELKYLICKSRIEEVHSLALEALKSSPGVAFYYYAMTMGSEHSDGLRWAKKGLKCTGSSLSRYVRFGLLFNAIEHAGLLGLEVLQQASKGERAWEEGLAILRSGLEDSKAFVAEAPPDSRHMGSAILWCTLLSIALRGLDLSPDLREMQSLFEKQKVADEIHVFVHSAPISKTSFRLARQTILEYYTPAITEWGAVIAKFDSQDSEQPSQSLILSRSADDELADWLNDTTLDGGTEEVKMYCVQSGNHDKNLELWRCSHCGNPSAMLKKCTRCLKARYCDISCQKSHWPEHKKACKAPNGA